MQTFILAIKMQRKCMRMNVSQFRFNRSYDFVVASNLGLDKSVNLNLHKVKWMEALKVLNYDFSEICFFPKIELTNRLYASQ